MSSGTLTYQYHGLVVTGAGTLVVTDGAGGSADYGTVVQGFTLEDYDVAGFTGTATAKGIVS